MLLLLCLWLLAACNQHKFQVQRYVVQSGDSLHFIAWKYQLDVAVLAKWNDLTPPYNIAPGDRLVLFPVAQEDNRAGVKSKGGAGYIIVAKNDTLYQLSKRHNLSVGKLKRYNNLRSDLIYPGQKLYLSAQRKTATANVARLKAKPSAKRPAAASSKRLGNWRWPTRGKVIASYKGSKSTQKGLDIAGSLGQDIQASKAGVVVYSGSGIPSYGHMVLIQHNKNYLSAYAYNQRLLVKEGQKVKSGQVIAKMGHQQGSKRAVLHFEIRKNGKPVNPSTYLPRQG